MFKSKQNPVSIVPFADVSARFKIFFFSVAEPQLTLAVKMKSLTRQFREFSSFLVRI